MYEIISLIVAIISMIAGIIATVYSIKSYSQSGYQLRYRSETTVVVREERVYRTETSNTTNSNDGFQLLAYLIVIFFVYSVLLYYYLSNVSYIVNVCLAVITCLTIISGIIAIISIQRNSNYLISILFVISWILLYIPIFVIKYSLFSSEKYTEVVASILNSKGKGIVWIVGDLYKSNLFDLLYITFQAFGIVLLVPGIIINITFIYRAIRNDYYNDIKKYSISYLVVFLLQFLFTTGLPARVVSTLVKSQM